MSSSPRTPKKGHVKGLNDEAFKFLSSFKKDGDFRKAKYTLKSFEDLEGSTNDKKNPISAQEYIAKELVGKKSPNQMASNSTKHYCLDKVKARMDEWELKHQDNFDDYCKNNIGEYYEDHGLNGLDDLIPDTITFARTICFPETFLNTFLKDIFST